MPASGNNSSKNLLNYFFKLPSLLIISCQSLKLGRSALSSCVGGGYFSENFEEIVSTVTLHYVKLCV